MCEMFFLPVIICTFTITCTFADHKVIYSSVELDSQESPFCDNSKSSCRTQDGDYCEYNYSFLLIRVSARVENSFE
jgi:hypothetical protein